MTAATHHFLDRAAVLDHTPGRRVVRLGAPGLPDAEIELLKTLCRLYAHRLTMAWNVAEQPPYDAIIRDRVQGEPVAGIQALPTMRLVPFGEDDGSGRWHGRPIRAERILVWFRETEQTLCSRPAARVDPASLEPPPEYRFSLLRWPPSMLLYNDAHRVRMAALLSRRALTVAELADLCEGDIAQCAMFLRVLQSHGLVDVVAPFAPTRYRPPAPAALARNTDDYLHRARTLIGGIRRRLGL